MKKNRILVLDDNVAFVNALKRSLTKSYQVTCALSVEEARPLLETGIQVALIDVVLKEGQVPPDQSGLAFVEWISYQYPDVPVVVMTGYGADELEVEALRLGAADYVEKDRLNLKLLEAKIKALLERRVLTQKAHDLAARLEVYESHELVGENPTILKLRDTIRNVAATDGTVFLQGESGVGKEVVAHAIHDASPRCKETFVAVNCAALSAALLESELFGHERGAFTGADKRRIGHLEAANGGTILFDEITEMDIGLQAKLLRVLQDKQVVRVGSSTPIQVDLRVIATTNCEPGEAIRTGKLRNDLYYRLNVIPVIVPPLRERLSDIPSLVDTFISMEVRKSARIPKRFSHDALKLLQAYLWPGNVRELKNLVERACVLCHEEEIPASLILPWLDSSVTVQPYGEYLELDFERVQARSALAAVAQALNASGGVKSKAQELVGIQDRSTFRRRIHTIRDTYPDIWRQFPLLELHYGKSQETNG